MKALTPVRGKREKATGRQDSSTAYFAMIPLSVLLSAEFHTIRGEAVRLLIAIAAQYRGMNNGNLCATLSVLKRYGFKSSDTVTRCLKALLDTGLIIRTRDGFFDGGRSQCALYALAWQKIDSCPGKNLTVKPTLVPPRRFSPPAKNKVSIPKIMDATPIIDSTRTDSSPTSAPKPGTIG